ncbi:sulfite exporter TauE/SafE family protein [Mucilaginibacter sp. KACC 22063]|uniref:sulfite exporter TauE/SafE family protein n=1 Tax=Mucilaginibacter sp. KACC 22063 TaxID=3025666 RepID=UPI0023659079|nr:sulfite exporter TauE/SafE family protein [Mucilaginibacter sp. KACC 22063]WDF54263.1 sulfite exporter TauE/SafE family protein [Mucilaginibacter sp. KACC 22063]
MTILTFTLLLIAGAYLAGLVGSLTGLGGGVVIIPLLTLVFHVDIRYAIGAALLASIANSSGAASAYVKEGITNIRLGMFLEIATTVGAVVGAIVAVYTPVNTIAILFGIILLFSAVMTIRKKNHEVLLQGSPAAAKLKLNNSYPTAKGPVNYQLKNVGAGFGIMTVAGVFSGLLGIGSGALKVLAMDSTMRIPFKVSTTTSNFMIGVTATASAIVYLQRGYMDAGIAFPVVLGVLGGAFTGSKLLSKIDAKVLKYIFCVAIVFVAAEMMFNGFNHKF